jgi:hypothetical protein
MQLWPQAYAAGLRVTEIPVRLIYNDPTRHFGGILDDARIRLQHYLDVLCTEVRRIPRSAAHADEPLGESSAPAVSSCCCDR